ncbi:MAG: MFS transporter, partial [Nitrospirota bacterium]|nr:MFS transporter [Nitrospirota bacterium]
MHSLSSSPTPSRVRWRILFLLLLISIITYIDRVNISVTARQMMPALGLTDLQMGQIFSAFVFGYALFQIPGGWLGDRWGPRRVLTFAVIWWSIFTALTAVAPTLPLANLIGIMGSLMVVRFLIGIGEAAALPNFNRAVANWHPPHERGLGIGITIGGIGVGSALTPPVTAWIMVNYGWQTAFYVAGGLGIGIALLWYWYATDHPRQHPQVNNAEAELIEGSESLKDLPTPLEGRAGKAWGTVHDSFADLEKSDWLHPASRANGNGNGEKKGSTTSSPAPPRSEKQRKKTSAPIPETTVPWKVILTTPTVWWLTLSYTCLGYVAYVYMSWFYLYLVNVRGF